MAWWDRVDQHSGAAPWPCPPTDGARGSVNCPLTFSIHPATLFAHGALCTQRLLGSAGGVVAQMVCT